MGDAEFPPQANDRFQPIADISMGWHRAAGHSQNAEGDKELPLYRSAPTARNALVSLLLLSSSACSVSSEAERLCRANIEDSLLNPETAEFHDFRSLSRSEALALWQEMGMEGTKARALQSGTPEAADDYSVRSQVRQVADDTIAEVYDAGQELSGYRVRAEGRLGNKVTSEYVCAADLGACDCYDAARISSLLMR